VLLDERLDGCHDVFSFPRDSVSGQRAYAGCDWAVGKIPSCANISARL
jgi:hypothetical protein